jgi:hypothetical protein
MMISERSRVDLAVATAHSRGARFCARHPPMSLRRCPSPLTEGNPVGLSMCGGTVRTKVNTKTGIIRLSVRADGTGRPRVERAPSPWTDGYLNGMAPPPPNFSESDFLPAGESGHVPVIPSIGHPLNIGRGRA